MKKEYKKFVKEYLSSFLETHHLDIHERLDLIETALVRIEIKIDRVSHQLDELEAEYDIVELPGEDPWAGDESDFLSVPEPKNVVPYTVLGDK